MQSRVLAILIAVVLALVATAAMVVYVNGADRRAILIPLTHRALDQGPPAQSEGAGFVATQLPTSVYLVFTALNSA